MIALRSGVTAGLALGLASLVLRCAPVQDPLAPALTPAEAALRLFELSQLSGTSELELEVLAVVLDEERVDADRAAAFEAVESLRAASGPRVDSVVPLPGLDTTAVDVSADLEGGGTARYSFQVVERPDASWRIVSIHAPGVEWPTRSRSGSGLSVSSPAGES